MKATKRPEPEFWLRPSQPAPGGLCLIIAVRSQSNERDLAFPKTGVLGQFGPSFNVSWGLGLAGLACPKHALSPAGHTIQSAHEQSGQAASGITGDSCATRHVRRLN